MDVFRDMPMPSRNPSINYDFNGEQKSFYRQQHANRRFGPNFSNAANGSCVLPYSLDPLQCNINTINGVSNGVSPASSTISGGDDHCTVIQQPSLSSLGQNLQTPVPMKTHQINDAKQLELMKRTGYNIVQRNGQRIFGGPPPKWTGPPPCKGTEIFVGKVPRDMFEWELVPIFERCGTIYELRLMMDFSGSNRGYLFVRYASAVEAKCAQQELNNFEIRPGKYIGVIPSVDNRKLWISGIPKNRSSQEIKDEMSKMTDGVTAVYIYPSHVDKTKTRGYAFVEYQTHRHAALARRKLVPGRNFLFDQEIERVDWAEPENEVDDETMARVKVLFIRNLSVNTNEDEITSVFETASEGQVERVKKTKDYAFVHFTTREAAERAFETTQEDLYLDNCHIEVSWSKPIDRHIHSQRKQLTKALSSANACQMIEQPPIPVANPQFAPMLFPPGINCSGAGGMMAPRPGGAAGIRGLGAPGTAPPKNLLRKLHAASGLYPPSMIDAFYEMTFKTNGRTFANDFHPGQESYNGNGIIPPGAPNSPPSNTPTAGPAFFNGNMRLMAQPMMPLQFPSHYYYGGAGAI